MKLVWRIMARIELWLRRSFNKPKYFTEYSRQRKHVHEPLKLPIGEPLWTQEFPQVHDMKPHLCSAAISDAALTDPVSYANLSGYVEIDKEVVGESDGGVPWVRLRLQPIQLI